MTPIPALLALLALGLTSCSGGNAPPRVHQPPKGEPVALARSASPPPPQPPPKVEPDAGQADAALDADAQAEAEEAPAPMVRASFALRAGSPPCRFAFRAGVGSEADFGRYLMAIERIETEASELCAAQVVFDGPSESAGDPDRGSLEGALLPKPGKLAQAAAQNEGPEPLFVDANFDGYLDLRVGAMSGAYNRSSLFWLFDPASKRFVRSEELESLLMPRFVAKRKRIEAGGRAGGPVYVSSEHEWVGGKLETVWSETTHLGETPSGKPLPKGFSKYKIRYERRGAVQQKVFDGPAR